MPDLLHSLQQYDQTLLDIIADLWGVELDSHEFLPACEELAEAMLDVELFSEIVTTLPEDGCTALIALAAEQEARLSWVVFVRRFGRIREMGPGRRDRQQPHRNPSSAAEMLFYRGLLARAFFDTSNGPQEFAYIPTDLVPLIGETHTTAARVEPPGRPASPGEKAYPLSFTDAILDDATTLLAALRLGIQPPPLGFPQSTLLDLLKSAGLVRNTTPQGEAVKAFLEAPRIQALKFLAGSWQASETFNELRQLPGLTCEGEWSNQPLVTREFLLELLEAVPEGKWWSLPAFVRIIKERYPDYQRPAGDYDSWFIKRNSTDSYLRGFEAWDEIDGALVRYLVTGPLYWLGQVDLAAPEEGAVPTAFRIRPSDAGGKEPAQAKIHVSSNGRISVPRLASRTARYLIARFCEWEEIRNDYHYHVTPASLVRAGKQGLKVEHLLALLAKHTSGNIPPVLITALKRWEQNGTEARVEPRLVLRVSRPEVLEELLKSKAVRFLGEPLGPTVVIVKAGAQSKVIAALAELGLLAEVVDV
ncbi:MAG: helicase-associated domain-containing protein [Anaerolineales bacterium]|nr:helicase-associated domain-containing protein [Anaerolineales bacterium]